MSTLVFLTSIFLIGSAYVGIGAWLVHRQVRPIYGYFRTSAALDAVEEKDRGKNAIDILEKAVAENPDSVELRSELDCAYVYWSRGTKEFIPRIKDNLFWLSKNAPIEMIEDASRLIMMKASAEEKADFQKIWEANIVKHGRSREILRKAAKVNLSINDAFSLACLREAYAQDPLDIDTYSTLTHWLKFCFPEKDPKELAKLTLDRYKLQIRVPWDHDDYEKFLILKAKTFNWMWPRPIEFFVLLFLGICRGTPSIKEPVVLASYADVALDAGDIDTARRWLSRAEKSFPQQEDFAEEGVEIYGTMEILDVLVRLALLDSDDEKLKRYLDYRLRLPMKHVELVRSWDRKTLDRLVESGKGQIAADFLERRVGEKKSEPYLAERITKLRSGVKAFDESTG